MQCVYVNYYVIMISMQCVYVNYYVIMISMQCVYVNYYVTMISMQCVYVNYYVIMISMQCVYVNYYVIIFVERPYNVILKSLNEYGKCRFFVVSEKRVILHYSMVQLLLIENADSLLCRRNRSYCITPGSTIIHRKCIGSLWYC